MNPNTNQPQKVLNRVSEHAAYVDEHALGTRVVTYLQGSQNYGMADEESDVDTKSLVVPSFRDLVLSAKRESHTLVLPNEEHADVKDVQQMMLCWRKSNVNFVECLFTPYVSYNPKYEWFSDTLYVYREEIAHYSKWNTLMATCGHMTEKFVKLKRAGEARADAVAKFGYDPKQLCHQLRLRDFLLKFFEGCSYEECLKPNDPNYLLAVKRGYYNLKVAEEIANRTNEWMVRFQIHIKERLGKPDFNPKVDKLLDDLTVELYRSVMLNGD